MRSRNGNIYRRRDDESEKAVERDFYTIVCVGMDIRMYRLSRSVV